MKTPKILSVGQCGFDHASITRHLSTEYDAHVTPAPDFTRAMELLESERFDLVLVNRVTDADGSHGLDLIRSLKDHPQTQTIPTMLVSNYADAQNEATRLGALRGFGKSDLGRDPARQALDPVLGKVPRTS